MSRAAVLGSPIDHSRSPDLHLAAYRALGLTDWSYSRIECTAEQLPEVVATASPDTVGFSVTMPAKRAALEVADERTERAALVGSANTLVRTAVGWRADCTDIDGMSGALDQLGIGRLDDGSAVLLGAGGTALPTVYALHDRGVAEIAVVARDLKRAAPVVDLATRLGVHVTVVGWESDDELAARCRTSHVMVSTVPADAAATLLPAAAEATRVVDVIYDPWPTPLAEAVTAKRGQVVGGLVMLLNQAYSQVEQFTGRPAPRAAMAQALGLS